MFACAFLSLGDEFLRLLSSLSGVLVLDSGLLGSSLGGPGLSLEFGKVMFCGSQALLRLRCCLFQIVKFHIASSHTPAAYRHELVQTNQSSEMYAHILWCLPGSATRKWPKLCRKT